MYLFKIILFMSFLSPFSLNASTPKSKTETTSVDLESTLRRVPPQRVCMVNDQVFEKDQIKVEVNKKAYYGCCDMCQERLGKDASYRQAKDPISGKDVDKATAVIGAKADGSVVYFENEANFKAYQNKK